MQPHNFSLIKMSQLTNLVEIDKSEHKLKDSSIIEMLDLSERFYNQPNFDKILKDIIVYYKQQLDEL